MKNPEELIKSAAKLEKVDSKSLQEYSEKQELIIAKTNELILNNKNIQSLIGEKNESKMVINHTNHVRFMESILRNFNPEIFVNTILWVYKTYRKHGFHEKYWVIAFEKYEKALEELLDKDSYQEVSNYYQWLKRNHKDFVKLTEE